MAPRNIRGARRGYAYCRIVTEKAEYPRLEEGERDLRSILGFEPNNLRPGLDLLNELCTYSGLEDSEVAEIAEGLAAKAERMMLQARALQIRALVDADRQEEARALAEVWSRLFPDDEDLADEAGMTESVERT